MYDLQAELDALTTAYVRSVRAALRYYLFELSPLETAHESEASAAGQGSNSPRGTVEASPVQSIADEPVRSRTAAPRGRQTSSDETAEGVLARMVALLTNAGTEIRSSELRKSLAVSKQEMQAAAMLGLRRCVLAKSGDRFTTAYSLAPAD